MVYFADIQGERTENGRGLKRCKIGF